MNSHFATTLLFFSLYFFAAAYTASPPALGNSQDIQTRDQFPLSSTIHSRRDFQISWIVSNNASQTSRQSSLDLDETTVRKKRGKRKGKRKGKRSGKKKANIKKQTKPRSRARPNKTGTRKPPRKPAKKIIQKRSQKQPERRKQTKPRSRARPNKTGNTKPLRKPAKKIHQKRVSKNKTRSKRCKRRQISCKADCNKRNKRVSCKAVAPAFRLCTKDVREKYPCPGQKLPMCKVVEKEPAVCKRTVTKTMPCSRKASAPKEACKTKPIEALCKPKECSIYEGVKCVYGKIKGPCESRSSRCNNCVGKYRLRHCTKTHTRRVEVSCPPNLSHEANSSSLGGALQKQNRDPSEQNDTPREQDGTNGSGTVTPRGPDPIIAPRSEDPVAAPVLLPAPNAPASPTPTPTPRPFEDAVMFASNVRCLASLFDEEECYHSDMSCQLFSETFDSTACAIQVCHDCKQLRYMPVSPGLKRYCFELLESSCRTLYSFDQTAISRVAATGVSARVSSSTLPSGVIYNPNDGKCYQVEQKDVSAPCNVLLSPNEHCVNGCIVGTCEKTIRKTHFCKDNLPESCKKPKRCHREQKECTVVKESPALCKFKIPVEYACEKKKTVSKPCIMEGAKAVGKVGPQTGLAGQTSKHVQDSLNKSVKMCTRTVKKKYVCGKKNVLKSATCVQKGCRARKCEIRTC